MPFLDEMFSNFSREIEEHKEEDSYDANESMRRCLTEVTVKLNHSLEELSETKKKLEVCHKLLQAMVCEDCKDEERSIVKTVAIKFLQERG